MTIGAGAKLTAALLNAEIEGLTSFQVITATGTWTKPAGCNRILVRVVGGGGAGGGVAATAAGQGAVGAGGGGGGYAEKMFLASALAATETVDIGAAGAAAAAGNNAGGNGGISRFATGKAYVVTANGGVGGAGGAPGAGPVASQGGAGGTATGGDINVDGDAGGPGQVVPGPAALTTNYGGGTVLAPIVQSPVNVATDGAAGKQYGGGSTGALVGPSTAARVSTAGAAGVVIVFNYT